MTYREGYLQAVRESICPICGSEMTDKVIDYSDWNDGHLLVVRDVPVRECQAGGHRFFQARVARALERLFELGVAKTSCRFGGDRCQRISVTD